MENTPELKVKTNLEITVVVNDRVFRPVIHRYLDLLLCSLKQTLRSIDFATVCNSSPQIYIQNHPLNISQQIDISGNHQVEIGGAATLIGLGELSKAWRDTGSQRVLQQDPVHPGPYWTNHAETYFTPGLTSK